MKGGFIISIANNKGGVGKTCVAVNLADGLARQGQKVLVVDNDSQCNGTMILLSKGFRIEKSLYDLLDPEQNQSVQDCIYATPTDGLSCLPNIPDTATLEPYLIKSSPDSLFTLRRKLRDYAIKNYDFTLIDNPPNLGSFVLGSLFCSDFVIIPNQAGSAFSLEGLRKAIKLVNEVRENGNPDLKFLRLLINMLDKRTLVSKVILSTIAQNFPPDQVFKTTIPDSTAFQQAELANETILRYAGGSTGAKSYRELAKELLGIFEKREG